MAEPSKEAREAAQPWEDLAYRRRALAEDFDAFARRAVEGVKMLTENDLRRAVDEEREAALLTGWEEGVREFAIWHNGEQLVGCLERPLREVLRAGPSGASPEIKRAFAAAVIRTRSAQDQP